ncbi:8925_t:CDS:2, partial [Funneliformis geosporum]
QETLLTQIASIKDLLPQTLSKNDEELIFDDEHPENINKARGSEQEDLLKNKEITKALPKKEAVSFPASLVKKIADYNADATKTHLILYGLDLESYGDSREVLYFFGGSKVKSSGERTPFLGDKKGEATETERTFGKAETFILIQKEGLEALPRGGQINLYAADLLFLNDPYFFSKKEINSEDKKQFVDTFQALGITAEPEFAQYKLFVDSMDSIENDVDKVYHSRTFEAENDSWKEENIKLLREFNIPIQERNEAKREQNETILKTYPEEKIRHLLVMGNIGSGKSALINTWCGESKLTENRSGKKNQEIQKVDHTAVDGQVYQIHEIPGFLDNEYHSKKCQEVETKLQKLLLDNPLHQIFLVWEGNHFDNTIKPYSSWLMDKQIPPQFLTVVGNHESSASPEDLTKAKAAIADQEPTLFPELDPAKVILLDNPPLTGTYKEKNEETRKESQAALLNHLTKQTKTYQFTLDNLLTEAEKLAPDKAPEQKLELLGIQEKLFSSLKQIKELIKEIPLTLTAEQETRLTKLTQVKIDLYHQFELLQYFSIIGFITEKVREKNQAFIDWFNQQKDGLE